MVGCRYKLYHAQLHDLKDWFQDLELHAHTFTRFQKNECSDSISQASGNCM